MAITSGTYSIGTTGDYTTPQTFFDDLGTPLTAQVVGECQNQIFTGTFTCPAITTTATNNVVLTTVAGASFRDDTGNPLKLDTSAGSTLSNTNNYQRVLIFAAGTHMTVKGLQISKTGGAPYGALRGYDESKHFVDFCIVYGNAAAFDDVLIRFRNCLIIAVSGAYTILHSNSTTTLGPTFYACTLVMPSDLTAAVCFTIRYAGTTANTFYKNCAFFGWSGIKQTAFSSGASDYNITDLSSGLDGANDLLSKTYGNQFNGTATGASQDYKLKSGSDAIGTGVADATNYPTDIFGTTRADPPCMGCFEFVSSGNPRHGDMFFMGA